MRNFSGRVLVNLLWTQAVLAAKSVISKNQKHTNLHELDRSNVKIWRSPHEDRFLLRDCISVGDGVVSGATADGLK